MGLRIRIGCRGVCVANLKRRCEHPAQALCAAAVQSVHAVQRESRKQLRLHCSEVVNTEARSHALLVLMAASAACQSEKFISPAGMVSAPKRL